MLQDVAALKRGVWVNTYQDNTPLWSLSYEWWFYMLFIPIELTGSFGPRLKLWLVAALAILGFATYQLRPNQISLFAGYFIIWWVGVEIAREYLSDGTVSPNRQKAVFAALGLCALLWTTPVIVALSTGTKLRLGLDPVLQARHFVAAIAILATGLLWRRAGMRGFQYLFGAFRILAPVSYSLYLLHVPTLRILESLGVSDPPRRAIYGAIVLLPVCYLLEVVLQRIVNRWTERFLRPRTAAVAATG